MTNQKQPDGPPEDEIGMIYGPKVSLDELQPKQAAQTEARPAVRLAKKTDIEAAEFLPDQVERIRNLWGMGISYGTFPGTSRVDPTVLRGRTFGNTSVEIRPAHVQIGGNNISQANPPVDVSHAMDGMLAHAKELWGGRMWVKGPENFKMNVWARAQLAGVEVTGYTPQGQMASAAYLVLIREQEIRNRDSRTAIPDSQLKEQAQIRERARVALGIDKGDAERFGQLSPAKQYDAIQALTSGQSSPPPTPGSSPGPSRRMNVGGNA
jgi:hypothetical protein